MRGQMMSKGGIDMTFTAHTASGADTDGFDGAYRRLVDARSGYDSLKSRGAPAGALIRARGTLHRARAEMAHLRRSIT
jgi:hypothetical protein